MSWEDQKDQNLWSITQETLPIENHAWFGFKEVKSDTAHCDFAVLVIRPLVVDTSHAWGYKTASFIRESLNRSFGNSI